MGVYETPGYFLLPLHGWKVAIFYHMLYFLVTYSGER